MERVLGIGGVFLRGGPDRDALLGWYAEKLGLELEGWGGTHFAADADPGGGAVWSIFEADTDYFGRRENPVMVNFKVADLDAMLVQLRAAGCDVDERAERTDFGAFGWVTDPAGNRVELWQPPSP